eukprot:TRINITY_DN75764_c0_g1_i1.p1 TRINITY_DN75764_c0_g1~~TRINITY_DN75764_c0_g1_i1.p1  ORF type:complete len:606 (-),score=52.57 TRINITY_DN75764_c0_g1_i1:218-1786(-)
MQHVRRATMKSPTKVVGGEKLWWNSFLASTNKFTGDHAIWNYSKSKFSLLDKDAHRRPKKKVRTPGDQPEEADHPIAVEEDSVQKGINALNECQWEEAKKHFTNGKLEGDQSPKNFEPHENVNYAVASLLAHNTNQAAAHWDNIEPVGEIGKTMKHTTALMQYIEGGNKQSATNVFNALPSPENEDTRPSPSQLLIRGHAAAYAGDMQEAKRCYYHLLWSQDPYIQAATLMALDVVSEADFATLAIPLWEALGDKQGLASTYRNKAVKLQQEGRDQDALKCFQLGLASHPSYGPTGEPLRSAVQLCVDMGTVPLIDNFLSGEIARTVDDLYTWIDAHDAQIIWLFLWPNRELGETASLELQAVLAGPNKFGDTASVTVDDDDPAWDEAMEHSLEETVVGIPIKPEPKAVPLKPGEPKPDVEKFDIMADAWENLREHIEETTQEIRDKHRLEKPSKERVYVCPTGVLCQFKNVAELLGGQLCSSIGRRITVHNLEQNNRRPTPSHDIAISSGGYLQPAPSGTL